MSARDPYVNVMRGATRRVRRRARRRRQRQRSAVHARRSACPTRLRAGSHATRSSSCSKKSHLGFVADPAAGAGVFEALTTRCVKRAGRRSRRWSAPAASPRRCAQGSSRAKSPRRRRALADDAARLKALMTGVSAHADLAEAPVDVLPAPPPAFVFAGEAVAAPLVAAAPRRAVRALARRLGRGASPRGARPKVFLAALGALSQHGRARRLRPRSVRSRRPRDASPIPAATIRAASAARFAASGATVACLCGDDEDYAAHGRAFARALKAAGARWVALAGGRATRSRAGARRASTISFSSAPTRVAALRRAWARLDARPSAAASSPVSKDRQ